VRPPESITAFFAAVMKGVLEVAKIRHVLVASAFGALCFGLMLGSLKAKVKVIIKASTLSFVIHRSGVDGLGLKTRRLGHAFGSPAGGSA
jgi:hypothetical protein